MTNGSLMKVKSIAECSPGAFCNTFDLHLGVLGLENQFSVILRVVVLHRFSCILFLKFYALFGKHVDPDQLVSDEGS